MANAPTAEPPASIAALPPTTVRQIGSSQLLLDPWSVVKELVDNSLDARAKAIFVNITANTVDSILVKDDGHGIPTEDRALVCRQHCTSKIRDFSELKEIGGKWLGFRGEALSSMAAMSGTLTVTTRVEGEQVARMLKYGRDCELISTENASHPTGTTVKLNDFFKSFPVREQKALSDSPKCLARIKRLIQAYSLARPSVRFRLHVLKAKNHKDDFTYAPKSTSNIEDAVFKVIGKSCASQCDWTAMNADGYEMRAFLPKANANRAVIGNHGAFVSVDARPVSSTRGTPRQIVTVFKKRIQNANPSFRNIKDIFFCLNVICPANSYDPNIEPAKDDVLFDDGELVVKLADKLFLSFYPDSAIQTERDFQETAESTASTQQPGQVGDCESSLDSQTPPSLHKDLNQSDGRCPRPMPQSNQSQWSSTMYRFDEEDFELPENAQSSNQEEEETREASTSNPWSIAKTNATIQPKNSTHNSQLMTPANSHFDGNAKFSSPISISSAHQIEPLTPQTSSPVKMTRASSQRPERTQTRNSMSVKNQQQAPRSSLKVASFCSDSSVNTSSRTRNTGFNGPSASCTMPASSQEIPLDATLSSSPISPSCLPNAQPFKNQHFKPPTKHSDDLRFRPRFFGQNAGRSERHVSRRTRGQSVKSIVGDGEVSDLTHFSLKDSERRKNPKNTDIREFFRCGRELRRRKSIDHIRNPLFNSSRQFRQSHENVASVSNFEDPTFQRDTRQNMRLSSSLKPSLAGSTNSTFMQSSPMTMSPTCSPKLSRTSKLTENAPKSCNNDTMKLDMEATFRRHEQRGESSRRFRSLSPARNEPQAAQTNKLERRVHRRTVDIIQDARYPRSSLERKSGSKDIRNIVLPLSTSIDTILCSSGKLDMKANITVLDSVPENSNDVFTGLCVQGRVMDWAVKINGLLEKSFERLDNVESCEIIASRIKDKINTWRKEMENKGKRLENISEDSEMAHEDLTKSGKLDSVNCRKQCNARSAAMGTENMQVTKEMDPAEISDDEDDDEDNDEMLMDILKDSPPRED